MTQQNVALALSLISVACFAFVFLRRLGRRFRWWFDVRRNRRRHPGLIRQEKAGDDPTLIAQKMMLRDRERFRKLVFDAPRETYPVLQDYVYEPYRPLRRLRHWWYFKRRWFFPH